MKKKFVVDYEQIYNMYSVSYIPCYILIDKEGKIIARWDHISEKEFMEIDRVLKWSIFYLSTIINISNFILLMFRTSF